MKRMFVVALVVWVMAPCDASAQFGRLANLAKRATDTSPYQAEKKAVSKIDPADLAAAAVAILQEAGYAIELANERIGTVTTDWAHNSGFVENVMSQGRIRRRVMVSILEEKTIRLQLSYQMGGQSRVVPQDDRKKADELLGKILEKLEPKTVRR